jgi:hypothetical protein
VSEADDAEATKTGRALGGSTGILYCISLTVLQFSLYEEAFSVGGKCKCIWKVKRAAHSGGTAHRHRAINLIDARAGSYRGITGAVQGQYRGPTLIFQDFRSKMTIDRGTDEIDQPATPQSRG